MGTDPATAPTAVRYRVVAFLGAMTFILYLDRWCMSVAGPHIQAELGLTNWQLSWVFGAFTLAYGLFEVPTGGWADRYGSRLVLTRIVVWWSVFTALTGAATGFLPLLAIRFLFGAGEAGALPSAVRVVTHWFPSAARGRAQGVVTTAMVVGGAFAPVVATYLIEWVGWRWSFAVFGIVGLAWAAAWYVWFRDEPADHPATNQAERDLIAAGSPPADTAHPPVPWRAVLMSRNVWLLGGVMVCGAGVHYVVASWYPKYLQAARGVSPELAGWLTGLTHFGGAIGALAGGFLTDGLFRRTGNGTVARVWVGATSYACGAGALLASMAFDSPAASAVCTAVTILCIQLQIPAWWATIIGISGRHVGVVAGLGNSMGVLGAFTSPLFLGFLSDELGRRGYTGRDAWDPGLYPFVGVMMTAAVYWLFVRPDRAIESGHESH